MMRKIAWFFIISSLIAVAAEIFGFHFPTISWAFNASYSTSFLNLSIGEGESTKLIAWFGYLVAVVGIVVGVILLSMFDKNTPMPPTTKLRIKRFKQNRRGYYSFIIVAFVIVFASMDQLVVGKRALFVKHADKIYFPAFDREVYQAKEFGINETSADANYRKLSEMADSDDALTVLMPLIPFDPTQDSVDLPFKKLRETDGVIYGLDGKPYNGRVTTLFSENAQNRQLVLDCRKGKPEGDVEGKNKNGDPVYKAKYKNGTLIDGSVKYTGEGNVEDYLASAIDGKFKVFYFPAPPMPDRGHYLGTTTGANDLVAYLYGGLQVNIKAAIIYIPAIYAIGVSIGLVMGFFGGTFDLVFQRIIEIFSTIPFLFVVVIFSSLIPAENRGLGLILGILIVFGWMGMTYLMRTAALKEKARDYVAAARVMGASTPRIIFHHILPNTMAILVTLVPFSVSSIVMSLTALDYLGFGLPTEYATWGTLLKEGLSQFSKPWLVTSAFVSLTGMLILVTFIGEAVRDAFDPKKFTTYN